MRVVLETPTPAERVAFADTARDFCIYIAEIPPVFAVRYLWTMSISG